MLDIEWIDPRSAYLLGSPVTFNLMYASLGEPSCVMISYTTWSNYTETIGFIGTSFSYCSTLFSSHSSLVNTLFLGTYATYTPMGTSKLEFSTLAIKKIGNHYITATIVNAQNRLLVSNNFTVVDSLTPCDLPYVEIVNRTWLFYLPQAYKRSDMITLSSNVEFNCSVGLVNQKQWFLSRVSAENGATISKVNLNANPTTTYSQLVFQPYSLSYGLYRVVYQVKYLIKEL